MFLNKKLGDNYHQGGVGCAVSKDLLAYLIPNQASSLGVVLDSGFFQDHTGFMTLPVSSTLLKPSPVVVPKRIEWHPVWEGSLAPGTH